MRSKPTVVIKEEEEESVHDGDEDATPERDSETRVPGVSPVRSRDLDSHPQVWRLWNLASWEQGPKLPQTAKGEGSRSVLERGT